MALSNEDKLRLREIKLRENSGLITAAAGYGAACHKLRETASRQI